MKKFRIPRKLVSLFALILALLMVFSSTAYATEPRMPSEPAPYIILRGGAVQLTDYDTIRTNWNNDGCQLDTCFLTGDSMLRRLRLTFDGAYSLLDIYQSAADASTVDAILYDTSYYQRYGYSNLRSYLTNNTLNSYYAADGVTMLKNLKVSNEYRSNSTVKWLVDTMLANLENYHAPQLRRALAYFCNETILKNMDLTQLKNMAAAVISTPEYVQFRNTLYGHDCSTVNELMNYGYTLDYISRLYSSRAEAAVKTLWPDYADRMTAYWRENRSW